MNLSSRNPQSCDTFLVLKSNGTAIFGKNSDRPQDEVHSIRFYPRHRRQTIDEKVCMTHGLQLPQVEETYAVILSQPHWMFGAEMGANEFGLVIGNEAIFSKDTEKINAKCNPRTTMLGMDYVRLGLERAKTAYEALKVITTLLEKFGQGGGCDLHDETWCYDSSFLIADAKEGYVVETTGKWWIAEKIVPEDGKKATFRNISNRISINTKFHYIADGLMDYAKKQGYWDGVSPFNFALAFSENPKKVIASQQHLSRYSREGRGYQLLQDYAVLDSFGAKEMMNLILRDHEGDICMHGGFASTSSMVSYLGPSLAETVHWFTGTTFPCSSFFKPFFFPGTEKERNPFSANTDSQEEEQEVQLEFWTEPGILEPIGEEMNSTLWCLHDSKAHIPETKQKLKALETKYLKQVKEYLASHKKNPEFTKYLFKRAVQEEFQFYSQLEESKA